MESELLKSKEPNFSNIRLRLFEFAASHSLEELLQKTLDEVGALTESPIGFYHFMGSDQKTLSLQAWSTRTVKEFCTAEGKGMHYGIDQAGVWVDCVHQRRPVIHNDYASLPHRKGMPPGHAVVVRELVVPIMRADRIVALLGVGNKPTDYTKEDVEIVSFLADIAWVITEHKRAEEALRDSEEKYKSLFDGANDAIFLIDTETGHILDANREAERLLGRTRKEVINMNQSQIHPPDKAEYYRQHFRKHIEAGCIVDPDAEIVRKDGTIVPVSISARVLQLHGKKLIQEIFRDCTEQKRTEKEVRNLSQMLMKAQERERQMISYELHDHIAQNLSTLKICCDMLFDEQSNISSELIAKTAKLSKLIEQTISIVRDLSYDLQPPVLSEMGLVHALKIYCEEFYQNSGIKVDFQSTGMAQLNIGADTNIHLFRLVQEGLNNVRKHANASLAKVKLIGASPNIILRIEDEGKGFDVKARELALDNKKRMGLRSMEERVNLLGGLMTVQSKPMQGTRIYIKIPQDEKTDLLKEAKVTDD